MSTAELNERLTVLEEYLAPLAVEQYQGTFLIKVPEWLGQQILSSSSGSIIGESSLLEPGKPCDLHLDPSLAGDKPVQFNLKVSQAVNPANTFMLTSQPQSTAIAQVRQAMHAIPTRSDAYRQIAQSRTAAASNVNADRRTVLDDRSAKPVGNVHMFKLASATNSPETGTAKRSAQLPHSLRAQAATPNESLTSEELVMKLLVEEDLGWNLQNFMKKFKDAGGSGLNLVQLKAKLTEICDYARRGEDSHPKYYLKLEYKST